MRTNVLLSIKVAVVIVHVAISMAAILGYAASTPLNQIVIMPK